jgi:AcrR family transcriptional regulator
MTGKTGGPQTERATPEAAWRSPGSTAAGRRSRERALEASLELITEVGIDRVRVAEIARRAGMSSGQLMYYFTSKERILLETLAWCERAETAQRRQELPVSEAGWPRLRRFVEIYLPSDLADPVWILWMEAWARAPHSREVSGFLDALMVPWRDDLAEIVAEGVAAGEFRTAPSGSFPVRFCAVLDGLSVLMLRQMPELSAAEVAELALSSARAELAAATSP